MNTEPCNTHPQPTATGIPGGEYDTHMQILTARWMCHIAFCGQHCRCGAARQHCTALADNGDVLCGECRSYWDPRAPGTPEDRGLLCAIFTHHGPFRPNEFIDTKEPKR